MTTVIAGSSSLIFKDSKGVVNHLLKNILANNKKKLGTEWEMFFVRRAYLAPHSSLNEKAFRRIDGQKAFEELERAFRLQGYKPQFLYERAEGVERRIGISIPTLGAIIPEAGHQFEFSSIACDSVDELEDINKEASRVLRYVAQRLDCAVVFKGHLPGYVQNSEVVERSRGIEWQRFYATPRFSDAQRDILLETQNGTASVQVTLDSGGEDFHEFMKALLLIEPAFTIHYANSDRSYIAMKRYGDLIPSQVLPISAMWNATSAREAVEAIVDRLMEIEVPFMPDPEKDGMYKASVLYDGRAPTVRQLMERGGLTERLLNNVGGFFYTRPAFRNFADALIEIRGVDSQADPEVVADVARRIQNLVYSDSARKNLLQDYAHLTEFDIHRLHSISCEKRSEMMTDTLVAGMSVYRFVEDVLRRSDCVSTTSSYGSNILRNGSREGAVLSSISH